MCIYCITLFLATADYAYVGASCFFSVQMHKNFIHCLVYKRMYDVHQMMIAFLRIYLSEYADSVELQYFMYIYV